MLFSKFPPIALARKKSEIFLNKNQRFKMLGF